MSVLMLSTSAQFASLVREGMIVRGYPVEVTQELRTVEARCAERAARLLIVVTGCVPGADHAWIAGLLERFSSPTIIGVTSDASELLDEHERLRIVDDASDVESLLQEASTALIGAYLAPYSPQTVTADGRAVSYTTSLPARVAAILDALERASHNESPLDVARYLAHRMYGSAAAHGYADLGEVASEIEQRILDAFARRAVLSSDWAALSALRRRLVDISQPDPERADKEIACAPSRPSIVVVSETSTFVEEVRHGMSGSVGLVRVSQDQIPTLLPSQQFAGAVVEETGDGSGSLPSEIARTLRNSVASPSLPVLFVPSSLPEAGAPRGSIPDEGAAEKAFGRSAELRTMERGFRSAESEPPRVLIVDDDDDFVAQATPLLSGMSLDVWVVTSTSTLSKHMLAVRPDLLIMSAQMPGVSGIESCRRLRALNVHVAPPTIISIRRGAAGMQLRAYRAGAADVVAKPLLERELEARVGPHVENIRLKRMFAGHDPLTGLWNVEKFLEQAEQAERGAALSGGRLAIGLLDLDDFSRINMQRGRLFGERILARLGRLLALTLGDQQFACRWGGDQIAVLAPTRSASELHDQLSELLSVFRAQRSPFALPDDGGTECTFSAGVAQFGADGGTLRDAMAVAERRLRHAKLLGRKRVLSVD